MSAAQATIADPIDIKTADLSVKDRLTIVQFAEEIAEHIRQAAVGHDMIYKEIVPVDAFAIASGFGIPVACASLNKGRGSSSPDWIAGAIRKESGADTPQVMLETSETPEQKLFTLAHELTHWFAWSNGKTDDQIRLGEMAEIRRRHDDDREAREFLANSGAHFLLMPTREVLACLEVGMSQQEMAQHFGVTLESSQRRHSYFDIPNQQYA